MSTTPPSQSADDLRPSAPRVIGAIVILLIYQGYTLSIVGAASPWIAKSFKLDQAALARLFAWMSLSALGALVLARLSDRLGRRPIIMGCLLLAPLCAAGAGLVRRSSMFALFQTLLSALLGGSVSSAIVLLAEELPARGRARGQAWAAFASAIGGVLSYIVIPFLLQAGYSWRWLFAPAAAGIILVYPVGRMLPVESRWSRVAATGVVKGSHLWDVFHSLYRRRALTLLACAALDTVAGTAVNGWMYFETVSVFGLAPKSASLLTVVGMAVGMVGFPIGAWTSERFGRVPTVSIFGGVAWLGALAFYWVPFGKLSLPFVLLMASYAWFKIGSGIMTVGANAAATELFSVALRGAMVGLQATAAAAFSILAQILIAALLLPLGGLTNVIRYFAMLGIPSAILFGLFIDETRGLALETASREQDWTHTLAHAIHHQRHSTAHRS